MSADTETTHRPLSARRPLAVQRLVVLVVAILGIIIFSTPAVPAAASAYRYDYDVDALRSPLRGLTSSGRSSSAAFSADVLAGKPGSSIAAREAEYDTHARSLVSHAANATETGGTGETAKPRDPVTDLPRDANGNIIGGVGGGRGKALSDAEAEAVRDFEAGLSPDQKLLNSAKDKLKGQEKYQGTRNKQKRGK